MDRAQPAGLSIRILEAGLCALVVVAPLPFGSVGPTGRLVLETLSFALTALWAVTALREQVALPPRIVLFGMAGLLVVGLIQLVAWGNGIVSLVSPTAAAVRAGLEPAPTATLSLVPPATASALRTGAALAGILLVATTVVAVRGARRIAAAALLSAAFQGLYGTLVLASGHDRIWNVPKTTYLDSATGTFVNRNHFAGFLAATLPLGVGLVIDRARRARRNPSRGSPLARALGPEGSKALLLGLLVLTGAAGILLSFSRAGTALGLAALAATTAAATRLRMAHRLLAIGLLVALASVPLLDLGADRLAARYATAHDDYQAPGGRLDVARDTVKMIRAFPVAGCGFGAFTWVFPAFSSPQVRLHYTHAHNDLLQLGAEGGLISLALLVVVIAALGRCGMTVVRARQDAVAIAAVFGLAALLLHGLVDFDFHIPADAATAALLSGVVFGASWNAPASS